MRKKVVVTGFVSLLALAMAPFFLSCAHRGANAVQTSESLAFQQPSFDGTLRVGTFNIAHGRGGVLGASNWNHETLEKRISRLQAIGGLVAELDLDVLVLNEVDFSASWSHEIDQAKVISERAGFPYLIRQRNYDVALPFFSLRFGNAILSKYPVERAWLEPFTPHSKLEKWAFGNHDSVAADIRLDAENSVRIWAVHLEVRDQGSRVLAANRIREEIETQNTPTVILGDFNSKLTPKGVEGGNKSVIDLLSVDGGLERFPHWGEEPAEFTFPSGNPERTIDWILLSKQLRLQSGEVVATTLSDHLPVIAEIRF